MNTIKLWWGGCKSETTSVASKYFVATPVEDPVEPYFHVGTGHVQMKEAMKRCDQFPGTVILRWAPTAQQNRPGFYRPVDLLMWNGSAWVQAKLPECRVVTTVQPVQAMALPIEDCLRILLKVWKTAGDPKGKTVEGILSMRTPIPMPDGKGVVVPAIPEELWIWVAKTMDLYGLPYNKDEGATWTVDSQASSK